MRPVEQIEEFSPDLEPGAIADGATIRRAKRDAAEALRENDSYEFFREMGDLVVTGPTGTNVMDLHLVMAR